MAYLVADDVREAFAPTLDAAQFTDELLDGLISEFEGIAERARGCAFEPREATATIRAASSGRILLPHPLVTSVSAVSVDGTALTEDQLDELDLWADESLLDGGSWSPRARLEITYTHGHAEPPPAILRACKEFVRAKALEHTGKAPRNALYEQTQSGTALRFSTADWSAGRYTGLMVVDDAINTLPDYRVPGIA